MGGSVTKFVNGHSDVVMGFVALNDPKLLERLRFVQNGKRCVGAALQRVAALPGHALTMLCTCLRLCVLCPTQVLAPCRLHLTAILPCVA